MPRTVHALLSGLTALLLAGCLFQGFEPPKTPPPPYKQHLQLGALFEEQGKWERAAQEYALAAQDSDAGNRALGKLYAQRGDLPAAEKYFRLAMRTIRDDAKLYDDLAQVLLVRNKDLEEAEDLAQLAVKIGDQGQFSDSWDTLVHIREARQKKTEPKAEVKAATKTEPKPETKAETKAEPTPAATAQGTPKAPAIAATPPAVADKKPVSAAAPSSAASKTQIPLEEAKNTPAVKKQTPTSNASSAKQASVPAKTGTSEKKTKTPKATEAKPATTAKKQTKPASKPASTEKKSAKPAETPGASAKKPQPKPAPKAVAPKTPDTKKTTEVSTKPAPAGTTSKPAATPKN